MSFLRRLLQKLLQSQLKSKPLGRTPHSTGGTPIGTKCPVCECIYPQPHDDNCCNYVWWEHLRD